MKATLSTILFLIFLHMNSQKLHVEGLTYSKSNFSFEETYQTIKTILTNNPKIGIVAEIDHSNNAKNAGLELAKTKLILFGNPNLGTPLMQSNMVTGLDLPQKIVVFENNNDVIVAYNNANYLVNRHQLDGINTIPIIAKALETIVSKATGNIIDKTQISSTTDKGIITVKSDQSFDLTLSTLKSTIENNENLKIIAQLDHQKNATKIGSQLNKSHLLIFGNPKMGTPLMLAENSIAIDLPQKMLVWEDKNGNVHISYNKPDYLFKRHGITDKKALSEKIANALKMLSGKASVK